MNRSRHCRIPSRRTGMRVLLATALLVAGVTQTTTAQRLEGHLLDLNTNEPIGSGILTLLTQDGQRIATAVTDDAGIWLLEVPGPGTYFVEAKRLGYQPWIDGPLEVNPGGDATFVYHLRETAVPLDPLEISAIATERYLGLSGFYERQRSDFGHFMEPDEIERRQATRITDLLSAIPGVRLVSTGEIGSSYIQLRGSNLSTGGMCRPRIFVDGLMYVPGDGRPKLIYESDVERLFDENPQLKLDNALAIDDIGHPSTIAAIEVYRSGAQVPVQFGGTSVQTQCGVIVVWTRVGRMRTSR
jgi:hypothetical protein